MILFHSCFFSLIYLFVLSHVVEFDVIDTLRELVLQKYIGVMIMMMMMIIIITIIITIIIIIIIIV